jgi:Protein of unknown function (DUF4241)
MSEVFLGSFEVTSGKLRVTDPCYDKDVSCTGVLDVPNGTWDAYVTRENQGAWGNRVTEIFVSLRDKAPWNTWKLTDIDVGVDSGQAGFFDDAQFPDGNTWGDNPVKEAFYDKICNLTCDMARTGADKFGGVVKFGAVSSSGYGDGGYNCYTQTDRDGNIVAAKIVFISDEDEEDYDDSVDEAQEWHDFDPDC